MAKIMVLSTCQTNDETKQDIEVLLLLLLLRKEEFAQWANIFIRPDDCREPIAPGWGDICMKAFRRKCNYDKLIMVVLIFLIGVLDEFYILTY